MKTNYSLYAILILIIFFPAIVISQHQISSNIINFIISIVVLIYLYNFDLFIKSKNKNHNYFKVLCLILVATLTLNIAKYFFQIKFNDASLKTIIYDVVILYLSFINPLVFLILVKINPKVIYVKIIGMLTIILFIVLFLGDSLYKLIYAWKKIL